MKKILFALSFLSAAVFAAEKPNVILIMTDDQGYGDIASLGNPVIQTPNLDKMHADAVRLTDFHVSPFCTPTRAAIMTGRYPARTGAYRTSSGRSIMHTDERTMAEVFRDGGYVTGLFGKWHLGDNAPHRPQDRGFQDVVWHKGGGVGQAPDYYGNDYVDDVYERNGKYEQFKGYCTDVFFAEAMRFVDENKEKPFFIYLPTNAPHSPYRVGKKWSAPYKDTVKWKLGAEFYGMITNLDHNLGLLQAQLDDLGLSDNTILIFMTDNGTGKGIAGAAGKDLGPDDFRGFDGGFRGVKSTVFEGGHRVPFFIRWPAGGVKGGRDAKNLTAHLDVLPTLAELCGIEIGDVLPLDGKSFAAQLSDADAAPHRDHYITQLHGGARFVSKPEAWESSTVVKGPWRLMDGKKLFRPHDDPSQTKNFAAKHPEVVKELRALYETFWASVSPRMTPVCNDIGNPAENPTLLCSQDWYMEKGNPPWHFGMVTQLPKVTGPWHVVVKAAGKYRFTLMQFPKEADNALVGVTAKMKIAEQEVEQEIQAGAKAVVFELDVPAGRTTLETWITNEKGEAGGAYFTEVEWL